MSLAEDIDKLLNDFGAKLSKDLLDSMNQALKDGAKRGERVQTADVRFWGGVVYTPTGVEVNVYSDKDYWINIEKGRKKGIMPPSSAFGEKWQGKNGIQTSQIIYQMQIDYNAKKQLTKRKVTKLPFKKAAKQFAFIVARAIKNNGIKPKPFRDRVVNDGRLKELGIEMARLVGKEINIKENILR